MLSTEHCVFRLKQSASSVADMVSESLEVIGALLVLGGFLSLNKSFGLGPENLGIKTSRAYRFMRHPIYSGYILAEAGFFLADFSFHNLLVLATSIIFLLLRLRAEEWLLRKDLSYRKYAQAVPWRQIPFLF